MTASEKGVSAHQVHRMLGISYKSTCFLMHRLHDAIRAGGLTPPMGEDGGTVEVDEAYIGRLDESERAIELAKGIVGNRLTYRWPNPNIIPF